MLAVWPALAVAVAGIVGGLVVVAVRGLQAWRSFKATRGRLGERLDGIARASEEIETHLTRASESSERLSAALDRLRRSRARLEVQLGAIREARAALSRVVPFVGGR